MPTTDDCGVLLRQLLDPGCLEALSPRADELVLDLGCGEGEFTARIASRARRVVAVDRDARALDLARSRSPQVEYRLGDAHALPLRDEEWGGFDVVHARFLLESARDPANVVVQMMRAVRRGGRVVLADDDHEALCLWPECHHFSRAWAAYLRCFDSRGNDSIVGRRLVELLAAGGATALRNRSLSFDVCAGDPLFAHAVERLLGILGGARDVLLGGGFATAAELDLARSELAAWRLMSGAAIWYVLRWTQGRRPG